MKKIYKKWKYPALLVLVFLGMLFLTMPAEGIFGSTTDWFSQHVALAETIRTACLEQKTYLPTFLPLGGGSNGFQFSYYGYLRPDVLVGCLFPWIPMIYFVIGYMLLGWLCSALLCYWWLLEDEGHKGTAFWGSVLFLLAACFFQTHRQVMFINYMPFLLAAFLSVKKKKYWCTTLCLVLIYVNSFYYSIAVLAALGWYWYREEGKAFFLPYIKSAACSIGMAAMLLIPTGLVLLEHRRTTQSLSESGIWSVQWDFSSLLYSPYGMGLTAVCLYGLIVGIGKKRLRTDSLCYLLVSVVGFASYLLNATLYVRSKILIPFVPLVILQCVRVFRGLWREHQKWPLWPFIPLFGVAACYLGRQKFIWIAVDMTVLFLLCILQRYGKQRRTGYALLLVIPFIFFCITAGNEDYVSVEQAQELALSEQLYAKPDSSDVMASKLASIELAAEDDGGTKEMKEDEKKNLYRFDSMYEPLNTSNRHAFGWIQKSTMYSSVTNHEYADVYYNLLKTPIRINNRVALLTSNNPFLLHFMGIRFIETVSDNIPAGYRVVWEEQDRVIAENPAVLPVAYIAKEGMWEKAFRKLNDMEQLDALMRTTIVQKEGLKDDAAWESEMKERQISFKPSVLPEGVTVQKEEDGSYEVAVAEESSFSLELDQPIRDEILLLEFKVENRSKRAVVIDINQIRNKLSGSGAPYPNENNQFHYQFDNEGGMDRLLITLAKGNYRISGVKWYTYAKELLTEKRYTKVEPLGVKRDEIFSCKTEVKDAGYFVTSIPRQRGMKVWIDGQEVPVLTVNEAFAGAEVTAGKHAIKITFTPPGLKTGYLISAAAASFFAVDLMLKKRKRRTVSDDNAAM